MILAHPPARARRHRGVRGLIAAVACSGLGLTALATVSPAAASPEIPEEQAQVAQTAATTAADTSRPGSFEVSYDGETWVQVRPLITNGEFLVRNSDTEDGELTYGIGELWLFDLSLHTLRVDIGDQIGTERVFWGKHWDREDLSWGPEKGSYGPEIEAHTILERAPLKAGEVKKVTVHLAPPRDVYIPLNLNPMAQQDVNLTIPPAPVVDDPEPLAPSTCAAGGTGSASTGGLFGSLMPAPTTCIE